MSCRILPILLVSFVTGASSNSSSSPSAVGIEAIEDVTEGVGGGCGDYVEIGVVACSERPLRAESDTSFIFHQAALYSFSRFFTWYGDKLTYPRQYLPC